MPLSCPAPKSLHTEAQREGASNQVQGPHQSLGHPAISQKYFCGADQHKKLLSLNLPSLLHLTGLFGSLFLTSPPELDPKPQKSLNR